MYGGESADVMILFDRMLIGPVLDKFDEGTPMMPVNETTCAATVHVQVSPTFFGWLAQFGNKMKVLSPDCLIEKYKSHIDGVFSEQQSES